MGMAASQARHLALVARKSNCEYEGQQINQARTVLSNQSANLFNQMLGLNVPVPPSVQDFTKEQYSYKDGANSSVIEKWEQLATPEEDYNYVVTHSYYTDVYTGSQKKMNDPQVQFASGTAATSAEISQALKDLNDTKKAYETAKAATTAAQLELSKLENYVNTTNYVDIRGYDYDINYDEYTLKNATTTTNTYEKDGKSYEVYTDSASSQYYYNPEDGKYYSTAAGNALYEGTEKLRKSYTNPYAVFKGYDKASAVAEDKAIIDNTINRLIAEGALPENFDSSKNVYYDADNKHIAFADDLRALNTGSNSGNTYLKNYITEEGTGSVIAKANELDAALDAAKTAEHTALVAYQEAELKYNTIERPTYIGNCELTLLLEPLSDSQLAELRQIVKDMEEQDVNTDIANCFDGDKYLGGIYQFKLNGVTYYTCYEDLNASYLSGTGINNIDGQAKLNYYNATYVSTKIEETEKALLETDGNGRFTSVRFENNSIKYTLNVETVSDDKAYNDAMNQYYYENAVYDKMVQDINAKTSLIQQQDLQLELRLKQLDTEQNALTQEIEAVSKVVKDNVDKSFKTFSG